MPDTMIERMALALWDDREAHQHERCRQTWEQGSNLARQFAVSHVRAVLAAMREPTSVMLAAGNDDAPWADELEDANDIPETRALFVRMIDAALAEGR